MTNVKQGAMPGLKWALLYGVALLVISAIVIRGWAMEGPIPQLSASNPAFQFMEDGVYRVYSIEPMIDEKTSEPIYWLNAGRMDYAAALDSFVEPHADRVKIYIVPRSALSLKGNKTGAVHEQLFVDRGYYTLVD